MKYFFLNINDKKRVANKKKGHKNSHVLMRFTFSVCSNAPRYTIRYYAIKKINKKRGNKQSE